MNKKSKGTATAKMPYKEFVERSIKALRKEPYKGIHVVISGFNDAFRQYYDEEPRPIIDKMVEEGFLVSRVVKRGAIIMLASDATEKDKVDTGGSNAALAKILSQS